MLLTLLFGCTILHFAKGWTNPCISLNVSSLPFCDINLSFQDRATDLVYTQEPKLQSNYLYYLQNATRADSDKHGFPALNVPGYDFHHEALHGLRGPKNVTQFPQVITTGATFNESLFFMIGDAISTESRAIFNKQHGGLTYWAPNVNIFRDPRWGRGQETPGEDPFVTSRYAIGFVKGMQGSDNKYLKTSACCKHFADYSVETNRHGFNAIVSEYDQNDTYLVAFQDCVLNANVSGIMCSYNSENSVPSCANKNLLTKYLRQELNFFGYITSDCGGVNDVQNSHHYTNTTGETIAAVFGAGMDLDCGTYTLNNNNTMNAINNGSVSVSVIQDAIYHATLVEMRLGLFDNSSLLPAKWNAFNRSNVASPLHLSIAYNAAQQGQVLLKNNNNALPLSNSSISSIALIGPNANNTLVMEGSYYGSPPFIYSVYDGVKQYVSNINYEQGCLINKGNTSGFAAAIAAAKKADVTIMVMGLDGSQEGEMHDRKNLLLPGYQNQLIEQVSSASKGKTILVILSGGCVDISNQTYNIGLNKIDAILWGGYGGMYGGLAVADVIFGNFNPSGRLSQTFYFNNYTEIEAKKQFNMRPNMTGNTSSNVWYGVGRGYRYYPGLVLYEFGTGLSYTTFSCATLNVNNDMLSTTVTNTGKIDGGAVVLVYFVPTNAGNENPLKRLVGFGRANMIKVGDKQEVQMKMYQQFYYSQ
eukprot:486013_1